MHFGTNILFNIEKKCKHFRRNYHSLIDDRWWWALNPVGRTSKASLFVPLRSSSSSEKIFSGRKDGTIIITRPGETWWADFPRENTNWSRRWWTSSRWWIITLITDDASYAMADISSVKLDACVCYSPLYQLPHGWSSWRGCILFIIIHGISWSPGPLNRKKQENASNPPQKVACWLGSKKDPEETDRGYTVPSWQFGRTLLAYLPF